MDFLEGKKHHQKFENNKNDFGNHQADWSHEAIAGAAGFGAMREFEARQRREGKPVDHAFAKEALGGLAAGEVDRMFETKGMDAFDRERAKRDATQNAVSYYDNQYGNQQNYDPNNQGYNYNY